MIADSQAIQESQNLSMFLAKQGSIREELKKALEKIKNFEDLICDIINISIAMLEEKRYLAPAEKHMLVKVMGFSLFLLDSETININKLDKKNIINLSKLDKASNLITSYLASFFLYNYLSLLFYHEFC